MATKYWVGGAGSWGDTAYWSDSSGGEGGASLPVDGDDVIFDSSSGIDETTVTIDGITVTLASISIPDNFGGNLYFYITSSSLVTGILTINHSYSADIGLYIAHGSMTVTGATTLTVGRLGFSADTTAVLETGSVVTTLSSTIDQPYSTADSGLHITGGSGTVWNGQAAVYGELTIRFTGSPSTGTRLITQSSSYPEVSFYIAAGTDTVRITGQCTNINFGSFSGIWVSNSASSTTIYVYGSITLSATMTSTANATYGITLYGDVNRTITSNGAAINFPVAISTADYTTITLNDALTIGTTARLSINNGILNFENLTITCGSISLSSGLYKELNFGTTGVIALTGAGFSGSADPATTVMNGSRQFTTVGSSATTHNIINSIFTDGIDVDVQTSSGITTISTNAYIRNLRVSGSGGSVTTTAFYILGLYTRLPSSGVTITSSTSVAGWSFISTDPQITQAIDAPGYTHVANISKPAGHYQTLNLSNNFTIDSTKIFNHIAGTLDLANYSLTTGRFSTPDGDTRDIAFGSTGKIAVTGSGWVGGPGITWTGSGKVETSGSSALTHTLNFGTLAEETAFNVRIATTSGNTTFSANTIVNDLTFDGNGIFTSSTANSIPIYGNLTITSTSTVTIPSTLNWQFAKSSGTQTINAYGTTDRALTKLNGGTLQLLANYSTTSANSNFTWSSGNIDLNNYTLQVGNVIGGGATDPARNISFGTGKIVVNGTSPVLSFSDGSDIIMSGSKTVEVPGAITFGVTLSGFTEGNIFNLAVTGNGVMTGSATINDLTFTSNGTMTTSAIDLYGNLSIAANTIWASTSNAVSFLSTTGTRTLHLNGITAPAPIIITGNGSVTLSEALNSATYLRLAGGTLDTANFSLTLGNLQTYDTEDLSLVNTLNFGSSVITFPGTGTFWVTSVTTPLVVTPGTYEIALTSTSSSARYMYYEQDITLNKFTVGGVTGTGSTNFINYGGTTALTFNTFKSIKAVPCAIYFSDTGVTNFYNFDVSGAGSSSKITLYNNFLNKLGGGTVTSNYLNLFTSVATPSDTWIALNSVDNGDNLGWSFGSAPIPTNTTNFLFLFM